MRTIADSHAETSASSARVWEVWTDPGLRPGWHPRLEWANLGASASPEALAAVIRLAER